MPLEGILTNVDAESAPSGDVGPDAAPSARHQPWCSAAVPEGADRCPACGVWQPRNRAALVVGGRSVAFWLAAEDARREIRQGVITDAGFTEADAPRALITAADGLAQAALLRDAAFARVVESGGPLTSAGRTRRAFAAWQAAADRTERYLRLVGLRRVTKAADWRTLLADEPEPAGEPADADPEPAA